MRSAVSAPTTNTAPGNNRAFSVNVGVLASARPAARWLNSHQPAANFRLLQERFVRVVDRQLEGWLGRGQRPRYLGQLPVSPVQRIERTRQ